MGSLMATGLVSMAFGLFLTLAGGLSLWRAAKFKIVQEALLPPRRFGWVNPSVSISTHIRTSNEWFKTKSTLLLH